MNEELMDFVEWLPNNSELFADMDVEAIIAQINDLASSDEGKETLEQLTKQYKSKEMGLFKKGGKLDYLLCLKKGGKVQDCGCGKKISKHQIGGTYVRRDYYEDTPGKEQISQMEKVTYPNGNVKARIIRTRPNQNGGFQRDTTGYINNREYVSPHSPDALGHPTVNPNTWRNFNNEMDGYGKQPKPVHQNGGEISNQGNVLPRYAKIVEQGWNKPRYTFLHDTHPSNPNAPLNTVTPDNVGDGSYEGMMYAEEQVANPEGYWVNQMNRTAGLPEVPRGYRNPDYRVMVNHPTEAGTVSVREDAPVDRSKANSELEKKQRNIRNRRK